MALPDITEEHYEHTFATNVKGTLFTVQKALPLLRDGASVILTGSTAGVTGGPSFSVYSASKAAIRNFRQELDPGSGAPSHPRERARSRGYLDPGPAWAHSHRGPEPRVRGCDGSGGSARSHGGSGRDSCCRALSRLG